MKTSPLRQCGTAPLTVAMAIIISLCPCPAVCRYHSEEAARNDTHAIELINDLLNRSASSVRPNVYGAPVDVKCDFYVQSLGPMNEVDMDFSMEIYFRQRWVDERLSFTDQTTPIILPPKFIDRVWLPDVYFPNEKQGHFHNIIIPNRSMKIYPNGTVRYSTRLTLRLACNMLLMNFPLDYQDCGVRVSSYAHETSELTLSWFDDDPVEYQGRELTLPQFQLLNISTQPCLTEYKTGHFACLSVTFHLKRQVGFYVLQTFIPSILIVMLSWVSFWISKDAVPARITLGVTTVLTMTTQLSTSRSNSMLVSYPKAIDIWYACCMIFVFVALLEYALVNVRHRAQRKRNDSNNIELQNTQVTSDLNGANPAQTAITKEEEFMSGRNFRRRRIQFTFFTHNVTAGGVDKAARIVFPLTFFLFNVVYWAVYTQPIVWKNLIPE